ncbi:type VI secretion protein [Porphyrobacter algicida]|uniref:Type VI secretion protein n=1 Tax=Qipengyuania algicida TaxID=1836209 RepID=A0A845AM11_9SPHN|nr:TrbI/VirB10 family protein [Qipengyuania algicida]MXP29921.1 type VI secretion protein [Qipengyuania algicida]
MKLPPKDDFTGVANDVDPRDEAPGDVIDLASRNSYPMVAQSKRGSDGLGMVAGIAIVAGLGLVTLWSMNSARLDPPAPTASPAVQQPAPATAPSPAVMLPPVQPAAAPAPIAPPAPAPVLSKPPVNSAVSANPNSSPTVVFDAGVSPSTVSAAPAPGEAVATKSGGDVSSASAFASRVGGVGGAPAVAKPMTNPTTTVTQGTLIPAVLETAIDTNVPGYVRAVVSQDVRSFDGSKVLIPRSSRLIGEYQSGLQNGQKRAYVIWTRLIRPDGASVNLASPAIAFDGTTGLTGKVNSHFFKRFGSALLLSVVGGLGNLVSGGSSIVLGGGQSAASTALQQDGQIGPTVRVRQGEPIRIFTARDLDFSQVG